MRGRIRTSIGVLVVAGTMVSACSSPSGIPVLSGDGVSPPPTVADPAELDGQAFDTQGFEVPWFDAQEPGLIAGELITGTEGAPAADARPRVCSTASAFLSAGIEGRSGSALLISGSAAPEPGDVPVRDRLVQMGFVVTVQDDDLATAADADGVDLVLISESASSDAIGAMFTPLAVPVMVWERGLFSELKMSEGNNWHTDPQDTIVVSDPSLTCGVTGEVTVVTSAAFPMNRAQPPVSATVAAVRSTESDQTVWFGYETGDPLTDGSPAPAARVALWFSYETPLHTNDLGWQLFAHAVAFAIERPPNTEPPLEAEVDQAFGTTDATVTTQPATSPGETASSSSSPTASAPPITTAPPTATPPNVTTQPTIAPPTPPSTAAPIVTTQPTTAPTTTTAPAPAPTTTAPPTATAPPTTTAPATTEPPREQPPGGGPPPWAGGPPPEPDDPDAAG